MALYNKLPTLRSIRVLSFKKPAITTGEKTAGSTVSDPGTQAVCCEMSVIPLTESEPFDALSYVWGNPSIKDGSMVCNGHTIDITPNLWAALTQIWRNWPQKRLWVDAVCINQQDIPERNQQVTMMGAIYRTAQCVVVWLGEPTEASDTVFELLEEVKDEPGGGSAENATMGAGAYNTTALKDRARDVGRLGREILSRPWFERAWTLQEIQLARRATICCGSRHADFGRFVQLVQRYNDEQFKESACGGDSLRVPVLPSSAGEGEEKEEDGTLFYHLAETSDRVASDPRDKLYCLLSLLPEDLYDFLEADYSLSVQETIVRASRICIELDEETGCLADAGLENRGDGTLPSWALDWRIPHDYDHHKKFNPIGRQLRTEGKEGEEGGGPERQRLRRDRGRNLQSPIDNTYRVDDKKLRIRGGALGRLELSETTKEENKDKAKYKHEQTARLSVFPECAMRWLGKPPDLKVPTWWSCRTARSAASWSRCGGTRRTSAIVSRAGRASSTRCAICRAARAMATGSGSGPTSGAITTSYCVLFGARMTRTRRRRRRRRATTIIITTRTAARKTGKEKKCASSWSGRRGGRGYEARLRGSETP